MAEVRMDTDHLRALVLAFGEQCYRAGYGKAHELAKDHCGNAVPLMAALQRWDPTVEGDDSALPVITRLLCELDARRILTEHEVQKWARLYAQLTGDVVLSDGYPGGFPSDYLIEALYKRTEEQTSGT